MAEPADIEEAVRLVRKLQNDVLDDDALGDLKERLDQLLPDPHYMAYAVDQTPELAPEEVVRRAFAYKPILL